MKEDEGNVHELAVNEMDRAAANLQPFGAGAGAQIGAIDGRLNPDRHFSKRQLSRSIKILAGLCPHCDR